MVGLGLPNVSDVMAQLRKVVKKSKKVLLFAQLSFPSLIDKTVVLLFASNVLSLSISITNNNSN